MTKRVRNDYESLKNFTENASHEIQTPLAIIKSKLELLSQSENLDETQILVIGAINDAASRLSKLNQSLLLLTKIENRQFIESERLNLSFILSENLENFEELAETKNIKINRNIKENVPVEMNESLSGILISNLIINSIKHNQNNGFIDVKLDNNILKISNTGAKPGTKTEAFFQRFKKDLGSNDSLGLGLSIVKKICDNYGFTVQYDYKESLHIVTIEFPPVSAIQGRK